MLKNRTIIAACVVLVGLIWGGSAQAQFKLTPGGLGGPPTGGQFQIGTGLPLPIGPAGIFLGGQTSSNGGTSCGMGVGGCPVGTDGPGTAYWPPLSVPANPAFVGTPPSCLFQGGGPCTIGQTGGADPLTIMAPAGVLTKPAAGAPVPIAVFTTNPNVFQVATSISFAWPAVSATFAPGGGPGSVVFATTNQIGGTNTAMNPLPGGGSIAYSGGAAAFGGAGRFAIVPGPGAAAGRAPAAGTVSPIATVWINVAMAPPSLAPFVAVVGASAPGSVAEPGAAVTSAIATTMFPPIPPGAGTTPMGLANGPFGALNVTTGGTAMNPVCCFPGTMGTIPSSIGLATVMVGPNTTLSGLANLVLGSKGFPWSTGLITVAAPGTPGGNPPETFFLSGTDMRVSGVGNISMVSGAVSSRLLSGPNANRGWVSLNLVPEPGAALGAGAALAALALCHGLVRRRSR